MDLPNTQTNIIPNSNSHPNPFSDPTNPLPNLIYVATSGSALVTNITKYLSTLPHPIEVVEELVAVCAVTASLLTSLHGTIGRFPHLNLSPTHSFIAPLCHDVLFAFKQLGDRVQEAKRMRVFEPNDVGLVRVPRCAWTLVLGTEQKVAALRSRLFVEKYRVRVLIEAVAYEGLRGLQGMIGGGRLGKRDDDELKSLRRMLPLIAERLVGVQKDYKPRLMKLNGFAPDVRVMEEQECPVRAPAPIRNVVLQTPVPAPQLKKEDIHKQSDEKSALRASKSTDSIASSITTFDDSLYETWLLRCNRPQKELKSRTRVLGIPLLSTHTYSSASYYVKPVLSSISETHGVLKECQDLKSPAEHIALLKQQVLKMDEDAQWELQKLVEAREKACSGEKVKREWQVVGLLERSRRKISPSTTSARGKKWWWRRSEKPVMEWVLVLKGETVDRDERVMPSKHEDAWPAPVKASPPPAPAPVPAQMQMPVQRPAQQNTILRHVEHRRVLSAEEAEIKMREIARDLFVSEDCMEDDSEDDSEDEDSEMDDDDEDEEGEEEENKEAAT